MNRRDFLKAAGAGAAGLLLGGISADFGAAQDLGSVQAAARAATAISARSAARPNIVLILADDLGYAGLTCQGGDILTPHLDSLAQAGVRATAGYVSCSLCAPTRAGLNTGRYQQRFGLEFNPGGESKTSAGYGLPRTEKTSAEYLKEAGYVTGMFGKWHLGYQEGVRPTERGFDEFFGFLGGAHSYYPEYKRKGRQLKDPLIRGTSPVVETDYLTQVLAREALAFIDHHKSQPFFLYLPFNAVHSPLQAPPEYLERFKSISDEARRTHAAMLTVLDESVGEVLDRLQRYNLEQNTLVVFLSDNGGPTASTTASNAPLNGQKATFFEGGIRIPYLLRWPGHVPAGEVYDQPLSSLDLLPTFLAAAGVEASTNAGLDGVDLLPYLNGQKSGAPHSDLFWRMGQAWAAQSDGWKLVQTGRRSRRPQLFDLAHDISESNDLYQKEPKQVKALQAKYNAWEAQMMDPKWQRRPD